MCAGSSGSGRRSLRRPGRGGESMEERFETPVPARSTPPMRTDGQPSRPLGERRFEISSGPAIVLTPVLPKLFLATSGAWSRRGSGGGWRQCEKPSQMARQASQYTASSLALEQSGAKEQNRELREWLVSESIV